MLPDEANNVTRTSMLWLAPLVIVLATVVLAAAVLGYLALESASDAPARDAAPAAREGAS